MTTLREVAIFTDDVDRAADFYAAVLGSAPTARWPGGALFAVGGTLLLIHARSPAGPDGPPNEDHIAFGVPDLDAASAALTASGRPPLLAARTYDWGRSAYLRDPDGRLVELAERA